MLYYASDRPPYRICFSLALQQIAFLGVYMVLSPLLARQLGLSHEQSQQLISSTFIASGLGVILQAGALRGIGSGLFCPVQTTSSTFTALALSKASAGLSAMFGLITVIGLSQLVFAHLFQRFRGIFSVQVAGIAVTLIGLGLGFNGIKLTLEHSTTHNDLNTTDLLIFAATLLPMIICNVWLSGFMRMISAFAGLSFGILSAALLSPMLERAWHLAADQPLFYLPHPMNIGWSLSLDTIIPGIIVGLFLAFHGFGALVAAQRFNDDDWKRPDLAQVKRGLISEGLTNLLSAMLNGIPLTSSGGAVSLAAASGCTSRQVAYWLGSMMVLIAFMPKVLTFWELLPDPIIGAALIFLASFTTVTGLQIISSRLLDSRKTLTIGIALIFGVSYEPLRPLLSMVKIDNLQYLIFTGVGLGVLAAVLLSIMFRFRNHTLDRQSFNAQSTHLDDVVKFIEHQGKRWGARHELVKRAEYASWQAFETIVEQFISEHLTEAERSIIIQTKFNEFSFQVIIQYPGTALPIVTEKPNQEALLHCDDALMRMSAYLVRRLADQLKVSQQNGIAELTLIFNDD